MNAPFHTAPLANPQTAPKATLYHIVGISWLVYWLTNSDIWMADVVPALNFYVVTGTFLIYFAVARPIQVLEFLMRPGIWLWALTALIPMLMYITQPKPSIYAYDQMRSRIVMFALLAGSGLVLADRDGPQMLRRAAGISLAVAIIVNLGEFFVFNPYNSTEGSSRSAGFYGDPNISGAAIGTLLLLYLPITKQTTRSLLITGAAYVAILATMSRSGMLFATGLFGAYLFLPRGPGTLSVSNRVTIGLGGLFALLFLAMLAFTVFDLNTSETWRLTSAFTLDVSDTSAQGRFDRAAFAWEQFLKYFWTGRGPGAAIEYGVSAHNTYLTLGYEYGIVGLMFYIGAISAGFLKVLRYGWARAATFFFLAAQIAYYSMFSHTVTDNAVFAIMFAVFLTNASLEPAPQSNRRGEPWGHATTLGPGPAAARHTP